MNNQQNLTIVQKQPIIDASTSSVTGDCNSEQDEQDNKLPRRGYSRRTIWADHVRAQKRRKVGKESRRSKELEWD